MKLSKTSQCPIGFWLVFLSNNGLSSTIRHWRIETYITISIPKIIFMCYHVSNHKDKNIIKKVLKTDFIKEEEFRPAYHLNGFDKPQLPVIVNLNGANQIRMFRWRLIPSEVKVESQFVANTLNARGEELFTKTSFQPYWQNRCLVICTGFFEPHKALGSKNSQSYYISPRHNDFFTIGAIWAQWQGLYTLSIVTVAASPMMAEIHNEGKRMPLILTQEGAASWLNTQLDQKAVAQCMTMLMPDNELNAYRVMDGIMNARINTNIPQAIEPYKPKEAQQMGLF